MLIAAAATVTALALYVLTLAPGLSGVDDTPKFQLLGAVLGTAHAPGYPTFVLLSHLFSYLPIGSLAYRANLLSAVTGALSVGLLVLLLRTMGASRLTSLAFGLSLAAGRHFWRHSLLAEVYTLASCLAAAVVLGLLLWRRTGRFSYLLAASACYALAIGNHLTIATLAIPILAYVLVVHRRQPLSTWMAVCAGAIAVSGFALYLFVMIRTWQQAPYLEESARTLTELLDVIRAKRFSSFVLAFDWRILLFERIPAVAGFFRKEMSIFGLVLMLLGGVSLARRDGAATVLIVGSLCGITGLTLNVVGDMPGFLVSGAFVFAWLLAGLGWETAVQLARRAGWRSAASFATVLAFLLPAGMLYANYRRNDLHAHTHEADYFALLFSRLPPRAAFVTEEYGVDNMLAYMSLAEKAEQREIVMLPVDGAKVSAAARDGLAVFAFPRARQALASQGVSFEPVVFHGLSLVEYLDRLPDLTVVAAAASNSEAIRPIARALSAPGTHSDDDTNVIVGLATKRGFERNMQTLGTAAKVFVGENTLLRGMRCRFQVIAIADSTGVRLTLGRYDIRARSGLLLAVMTFDGTLLLMQQLSTDDGGRVFTDLPHLPLWRLTSAHADPPD